MADEQFFNDKRNDLDGDGIVDEKDINIMAHSAAAQAKVEKNMMEDVSIYNLRKINEERKGKHMENENKSPEEQLRDKVIAHEENEQEAREFNAMVKEGKVKGLTDEEKELKAANKEMKENEAEYSFSDREREDKDLERDEGVTPKKIDTEEVETDTKTTDKKVDEEEVEANSKPKTKNVEEEELDTKPKDKKVDEEEVDEKTKTTTKTKDKDAEVEDKAPKQTDIVKDKGTDVSQQQPQQIQPQQDNKEFIYSNKDMFNDVLDGLTIASVGLGGMAESAGQTIYGATKVINGLGKGLAAAFQNIKKHYNGAEYRPPEGIKSACNGVANFMSDIVSNMPPEFNNPITQAMVNSLKITPTRDANVNKDKDGNFQANVVDNTKDANTQMVETMIKDRLVNENTMGMLGAIHLAGGTTKDKDGHIVLKEEVYNALENKLDKKEVAALGASLYAVNNPDKLDVNNRHINSVVEMAKGFNEPEKLEKSLNVLYEAGGKELASNPERSTESILVSPANIVHVSQALKDTNALDTKSFDKQLDAVTKGIKEVNQVNHTIVSRDASKSMSKILDFIQEREQSKDMSKGHDKERKQER